MSFLTDGIYKEIFENWVSFAEYTKWMIKREEYKRKYERLMWFSN